MRPVLVLGFLLCLGANTVALAATELETDNLFGGLNARWASSWALGDLDGDKKIDLVSARPGLREAQGYAHEVRVHFGGPFENGSFTFHGRSARIQLSIRDLDGDEDRDIVILEGRSSGVVGVWLNDGAGHFHEGNVADFRAILEGSSGASLRPPAFDSGPNSAIFEPGLDPADLTPLVLGPEPALARMDRESTSPLSNTHCADSRSRAPPVQA